MFGRLGGLAFPSGFLSPSLLAFSLEYCIRVSPPCTLYFSYSLLGPRSLGMATFVLHFLYLAGLYSQNVCNVCFTFLLCVIALCMMYAYMCMGDHALCMMDFHGYVSDPLQSCELLTLWHGYMLKAFAAGAYSCHIVCIIIAV